MQFDSRKFQSPENGYHPLWSWVWNGALDHETILSQLDSFVSLGIHRVYIIPEPEEFRPQTAPTELRDYLSDEFLAFTEFTVKEAKKRGIDMWLYDEAGWPSGSANWMTTKDHPELRRKKLLADGSIADAGPLPDLMDPRSCERFLALTHEAYRTKTDGLVGDLAKVIFTDEPAVTHPAFTEGFDKLFRERFGYDILPFAPALYDPDAMGEEGRRARIDYYDLTSELFRKNYFDQIRNWCAENGMLSAGHVNAEDSPIDAIERGNPYTLRLLRGLDIPGVDAIWRQIFPYPDDAEEKNFFYPRFASSAARSMGNDLSLTESFAAYGSGLTFSEMRFILNYQAVRGINIFNFMEIPYMKERHFMAGLRPLLGLKTPGYEGYASLDDYTARLSYAAALGSPLESTALYMPIRDVWSGGDERKRAVKSFTDAGNVIEAAPASFDIIDDDFIRAADAASLEEGRMALGLGDYTTVVVPVCRRMPQDVSDRLARFEAAGGKVIRLTDPDAAPSIPVSPIVRVEPHTGHIRAVRRADGDRTLVMVFNESAEAETFTLSFADEGVPTELLLDDGRLYAFEPELTLASGEMKVYLLADKALSGEKHPKPGALVAEPTRFTLQKTRAYLIGENGFIDSTLCEKPVETTAGDWRDTVGEDFSGDAVYRFSFTASDESDLLLDLGEVKYTVTLTLNGRTLGLRAAAPYTFVLPKELLCGQNAVALKVSNTAANQYVASRSFDKFGKAVGPYHEKCKGFEIDSLSGGLIGPVKISRIG